jgi:sugar O-acyltransferase (sialic acid O-acetyltransferase NeuD family)
VSSFSTRASEDVRSSAAPLIIFGAGGAASSVIDAAARAGRAVRFLIDETHATTGTTWRGIPVLASLAAIPEYGGADAPELLIAVGDGAARLRIARQLLGARADARFATLVPPDAFVSDHAELGVGCVVGFTSLVGGGSVLGDHVMLLNAVVGHDDHLGDGVTLAPGAKIAGGVTVGARTTIGMNASIREGITVGADVVIGAHTFVAQDVPDGALVVGVPGRIVRDRRTTSAPEAG